jgi:hypothetical protein
MKTQLTGMKILTAGTLALAVPPSFASPIGIAAAQDQRPAARAHPILVPRACWRRSGAMRYAYCAVRQSALGHSALRATGLLVGYGDEPNRAFRPARAPRVRRDSSAT